MLSIMEPIATPGNHPSVSNRDAWQEAFMADIRFFKRRAPARPLQARQPGAVRCRREASSPAPVALDGEPAVLIGRDGNLTLTVRRWRSRLYLQRRQRLAGGGGTTLSLVFHRQEEFAQWCSGDPARFDEPLLLAQLRRLGDEAFHDAD